MLTYLIQTTTELIVTAVILGFLFAYAEQDCNRLGKRIILSGVILGVVASIIMSYMKNMTSKVDTSAWNLRIFALSLLALLVFFVFSLNLVRKKTGKWSGVVSWASMAILAFTLILYAFPDVWAYPYSFLTVEQTVLSTEFLYKLIGYLLGLILVWIAGMAVFQGAGRMQVGQVGVLLKIVLFINALQQLSIGLQAMLAKRIIASNHTLFMIAKYSSNYSDVFIYSAMLIAAVVPVVLWIRSFHVKEPYRNPAEKRKIKAKWKKTRRWATVTALALLLSVMNMTVVKAIDNQEVALSPVEDSAIEDGNVCVTFDQVSDGHLHRFAYTSEGGTEIRFIVIQKPNSSSYGIGLDACDICGETGYYEKDDQVVCKLCDVVMNISTIGFKGGCNPIVIDYQIKDGKILVPVEVLLEHEDIFKR